MYVAVAASRPRCLVVASGLTAALWGAAAVLARELTAGQPAGPDGAVVRLCVAALVVAVGWAWVQGMAGVADAWRGVPRSVPRHGERRGIRTVALAACGVAIVGALTAPAQADRGGPRPDPLAGLPLPERAEGRGHAHRTTPDRSVVVRPGDTLWALAEHQLPRAAGGRRITSGWHRIYRDNRAVIGDDPDLILPGQVLRLTKEQT